MPLSLRSGLLTLVLLIAAQPAAAQYRSGYTHVPINVSLVRTISINHAVADATSRPVLNNVSLDLLTGKGDLLRGVVVSGLWGRYTDGVYGIQVAGLATASGEWVQGIQAAGLANVAGEGVLGVQAAGLANVVGASAQGVQAAGLANIAGSSLRGVQAGGLMNLVGEDVQGGQLSGLFNIAGEEAQGVQGAGLFSVVGSDLAGIQASGLGNIVGDRAEALQAGGVFNIVGDELNGVQLSGAINIVGETLRGVQSSSGVNIIGEDLVGLQAAGGVNIVGGRVRGVQAGAVNLAPEVRGVQLGVINVADAYEGVPIGLVSYVRRVGLSVDAWADETGFVHAALRSGTARFSNYVGIGTRPFGDRYHWASVVGVGLFTPLTERTAWAVDLLAMGLGEDYPFQDGEDGLGRLRVTGHIGLAEGVAVFGGASLSVFVSETDDGGDLAPWTLYEETFDDVYVRVWPGALLGLRFQIVAPRAARRGW